jgi:hypothetical protein
LPITERFEHDRLDTDQRTVADRAAVQHDLMADRDAAPNGERRAGIGVKDAQFLNVAVVADDDRLVVAAQHGAGPDAHPFAQDHGPDDGDALRDVAGGRNHRHAVV